MTEPTARERLAEKLCEVGVHMAMSSENEHWQQFWLRLSDAALAQAREEVLAPIRALADRLTEQEQRCRDEAARTRIIGEQAEWERLADNLHDEAARVRRAIAEAGSDE